MGKNVLVILGSPRKNGNSEVLASAFIKGARAKGHTVNVFESAVKTVQGCRACRACWTNGQACVFEDGFRELAPMAAEADVLVLVSPLYWYGFSAQMKAAVDKFYSFMVPQAQQKLKFTEAVLLMTAEDDRPEAFTGPVGTYKEICNYLNLVDRGMVTVGSVNEVGAIEGNPLLQKAEEIGAAL